MFTVALIGGQADGTILDVPGIDAPVKIVRLLNPPDVANYKEGEIIDLEEEMDTEMDTYCYSGEMTLKGYLIATLNGVNIPKNVI